MCEGHLEGLVSRMWPPQVRYSFQSDLQKSPPPVHNSTQENFGAIEDDMEGTMVGIHKNRAEYTYLVSIVHVFAYVTHIDVQFYIAQKISRLYLPSTFSGEFLDEER